MCTHKISLTGLEWLFGELWSIIQVVVAVKISASQRLGSIYGESMLYNYKLYLQCFISLTWIKQWGGGGGKATEGPMLCIYMAMRLQLDRLWVLRTSKRGWGFGGLCRNIAEDELASHYRWNRQLHQWWTGLFMDQNSVTEFLMGIHYWIQ